MGRVAQLTLPLNKTVGYTQAGEKYMRNSLFTLIGRGVFAVAAIIFSCTGGISLAADTPAPSPEITVTDFDRTMGNPKAPVTLIEYASPGCPICARFNDEVFPQLKQAYIDTGKVNFVFRVFPLWPSDGDAEKLARCLPADRYFSFLDVLFRNQSQWAPDFHVSDDHVGLRNLAKTAGISAEQADKCMSDTSLDSTINEVAKEAQSKYHVNGTPSIVVDGVAQPSGFISFGKLSALLDAEMSKKLPPI